MDKMKEAIAVIAEVNDSSRLRQFLETGMDRELLLKFTHRGVEPDRPLTAGDATSETRMDMPRGLNQLGNTCYLNSLLQASV